MLKQAVEQAFQKSFDWLSGTKLYEFQAFLEQCRDRLNQPMQVAVIGEICASKSTLVNAMLGQEEVVRTGTMEETFNVSWLKYGDPESDIMVHFRSPQGHCLTVSRENWAEWANRRGQNAMKKDVGYIEVQHDNPRLNTFNLIDTPGLNAHYGTDSRNTIEFLNNVRPDAIVLLFTKSIAQRTIDILKEYQGQLPGDISPVNAIGVISKVDAYWPAEPDPINAGKRVADRLFSTESSVKKTLYRLYPLCAALALGGRTLTLEDMESFKSLSTMEDRAFKQLLSSIRRFEKNDPLIPLPVDRRKQIANKFTRYGVECAVNYLKDNPNCSLDELGSLLARKSGFDVLNDSINRHFGSRAYLIKLSGIFSDIRNRANHMVHDVEDHLKPVIRNIGNLFAELALTRSELQEFDLLRQYYNGEVQLTDREETDLKNITGENGGSCVEKLGLPASASIKDMKKAAQEKHDYWHKKFVTSSLNPSIKTASGIMKKSYRSMGKAIEQTRLALDQSTNFLWGRHFGDY